MLLNLIHLGYQHGLSVQISVCSESSEASSISMPRYGAVIFSFGRPKTVTGTRDTNK